MKTKLHITFHGRAFPSGLSMFTARIGGALRTYRTDRRGRNAQRAAREYFATLCSS